MVKYQKTRIITGTIITQSFRVVPPYDVGILAQSFYNIVLNLVEYKELEMKGQNYVPNGDLNKSISSYEIKRMTQQLKTNKSAGNDIVPINLQQSIRCLI